jgi:hypothetical protein
MNTTKRHDIHISTFNLRRRIFGFRLHVRRSSNNRTVFGLD